MLTMAVLARYGSVQPDVYEEMDPDEANDLAMRLTQMHKDELDIETERTKALIQALGARVV